MTSVPATNRTYHGFDYLRAILSIAIVAWHARVFGLSAIFSKTQFPDHQIQFSDIVNFHFFLLGVPTFVLVSLFLSYGKLKGNPRYIIGRVEGLVVLYVFWVGLVTLVNFGAFEHSLQNGEGVGNSLQDGGGLAYSLTFYVGWVAKYLATGGSSEFYFFSVLIVLTCLCYLVTKISRPLLWVLLAASSLVVWLLPAVTSGQHWHPYLAAYWTPLPFLPYLFVAGLVWSYLKESTFKGVASVRFKILLVLLLVVFLLAAIWEWRWLPSETNFEGNGSAMPLYTRLSVVAGASLLFLAAFFVKHRPSRFVMFLSDYSLGLYCIHPFVLMAYEAALGSHTAFPWVLGKFVVAVGLSLLCAVLLRRLLAKRLV